MSSKAVKRLRREERQRAEAVIAGMTDAELKTLRFELGREIDLQARVINALRERQDAVKREIDRRRVATGPGLHISDHAVVRYLERFKGLDVAAIREEIATMAMRAKGLSSGQKGARRDAATNAVLGVNDDVSVVTTIYTDSELAVATPPTSYRVPQASPEGG